LLISHDRALLDDVCDKLVVLDGDGNTRVFDGSYRDWEAKQKAEAADAAARAKKPESKAAPKPATKQSTPAKSPSEHSGATAATKPAPATPSNSKPSGNKQRSKYSNLALEKIEARISEIGRELTQIDFEFADPKTASDAEKTKKLLNRRDELGREQSDLEEEWMRKSG
jgi:ATPase subunit of ABC transporter with duplicated ATPase domains